MLSIVLPATDLQEEVELTFEHSLASLSKWESIHKRAFFGKDQMTEEETLSYIEQMLLSPPPCKNWSARLTSQEILAATTYINDKQTATWFREDPNPKSSSEVVTNELIYFWMISFKIPFECDKWHLSRLMTLIEVCGRKQSKPKKMTRQQQAEEYRRLNAARRAELGTTG